MMKLYVGNFAYTMTEHDIDNLFSPHGEILKVNLIKDHFTRQSKCFAYVQMADRTEGDCARRELNGSSINGRHLVVKEARTRDERGGHPW